MTRISRPQLKLTDAIETAIPPILFSPHPLDTRISLVLQNVRLAVLCSNPSHPERGDSSAANVVSQLLLAAGADVATVNCDVPLSMYPMLL